MQQSVSSPIWVTWFFWLGQPVLLLAPLLQVVVRDNSLRWRYLVLRDSEEIIDLIYEAAVVPELWKSVLDSVADVVDAVGTLMAIRNADGWGDWRSSNELESFMVKFTGSDIPSRTEATTRLIHAKHPGFLTERDLFSAEEELNDPLFSELARPLGFGSGIATAIEISTGDFVVFQMFRRLSQVHFDSRMVKRLNLLRPHLARSAMLSARLRLQRLQAAAEALAIIGLPAGVLSKNGRVLAANRLLEEMTEHVFWLSQDRMALKDASANGMFIRAVEKSGKDGFATSCSFPIQAANGGDRVIGHLIPTRGQARDIFDGATAIFVVTPLSSPKAPEDSLIQALYDLTPAEARVARGVVEGETVANLARRFGVSHETIRSQLKNVFSKTGVQRQADLVSQLGAVGVHRVCLK